MPLGSGRKGVTEWAEVSSVPFDKNEVKCKHCGYRMSAKIERTRIHLNKF